jgi:DNA-binding IclR family transcriptional regulator
MTRRRDALSQRKKKAVVAADDGSARYLVPALMRGMSILRSFSNARSPLSLSDVAADQNITRSSAYRLLYTLSHLGFVVFDAETKTYTLGSQVLHLGYSYLASRDVVEIATPHLVRLRDRTGWSAHLGELHGREVVYLARIATRRTIASTVNVGTRLPARLTTMGRILLSGIPVDEVRELYRNEAFSRSDERATLNSLVEQLAEDRAAGVVVQKSGYEPGVASIAAPIRDVAGHIVAAINISTVALLTNDAELYGPLKADVMAAAQAISRDLGHQPDTFDNAAGSRRSTG